MAKFRVGISGWRYPPWRGTFYPAELPQREELSFASRQVSSIEINGTFYSLQRPSSYATWYAETPKDFVFSVKAPRFITHIRRLRDIDGPMANFFASGVLDLQEKLGPFLWQFPPSFKFDEDVFSAFLAMLPHTSDGAVKLAQRKDAHLKYAATTFPKKNRRLRHAVEIRNDSFATEAFVQLLRQHDVALVVADTAGKWPFMEDVTAGFMYLRLHGDEELYASGYGAEALDQWASKVRAWLRGGEPRDAQRVSTEKIKRVTGRDVYCYFDNDVKVKAPGDAIGLRQRVGG